MKKQISKISFLYFIVSLLNHADILGQATRWPVDPGNVQHNVTGSTGEYRNTDRFHLGTDITGGSVRVFAVNAGDMDVSYTGMARTSYITVGSVYYYHVKLSAGSELKKGSKINIGDEIGEMIVQNQWPTHVHLQESTINYLNHRLYPYIDKVAPTIDEVHFRHYREGENLNSKSHNNNEFPSVVNNGISYRTLYNKSDIIIKAGDQGVGPTGTSNGNHIAPFSMWYQVKNSTNKSIGGLVVNFRFQELPDNQAATTVFGFGTSFRPAVYFYNLTSHPNIDNSDNSYHRYWNTNQRTGTIEDWLENINMDSRVNDESLYPDGKYSIPISASDVEWDITQSDTTNFNPVSQVILDNFRPYVKKVGFQVGESMEEAVWNWDEAAGQLVLKDFMNMPVVCSEMKVVITMSEPMKNVELKIPSISFSENSTTPVAKSDSTKWEFKIPAENILMATQVLHKLVINGNDLANTSVQGFTSKNNLPAASIQRRREDGTWPTGIIGPDEIHEFKIMSLKDDDISVNSSYDCITDKTGTVIDLKGMTISDYEFAVDNDEFQESNKFQSLSVGTHKAKIRFKHTICVFSKDFTVNDSPNQLNVTISGLGTIEFCTNNKPPVVTLTANASGGSGNYDYTWAGGSTIVTSSGPQSVTVTDKETGCKKSLGGDVVFVPIICSRDPNDIIGPDGYGQGKMVAKSKAQAYMIRFENDPNFATAPAQVVKINHPLDANVNLLSLRLGDFGFGGFTFPVPQDKTYYSTRLNLVDSLGVVVDVTAGIDVVKKEAFWIFESKDPTTGLAPANANLGFLPVNDSSTKGEGYVTYTVKAASNTQTGDSIHAKASIVFDINAPIETPVIFNTIDAVAPASKVNQLPPTSNSTTFNVSWSGRDDTGGSGIREYDLYVADSGSIFSVYQKGIADTAASFTGALGTTYQFFTIATDNVGNQEAMKNAPEASVTITAACPTITYYPDADGDGYGASTGAIKAVTCDGAPQGYSLNNTDCNDNDPAIHPGAPEIPCNGKDDNCDGQIDEGSLLTTYYQDLDGDGYGDASRPLQACTQPAGYVNNNTDCNDNDNTIYPGAPEICDGKDNNCNGLVDEGLYLRTYYRDADRDGYGTAEDSITTCSATVPFGYSAQSGDCNDHDMLVYPGAPEICDGKDNDCNGIIDDGFKFTLFRDEDGDGFGDSNNKIQDCQLKAGYVFVGGDCDNKDPHVHLFAAEICGNGIDDNCNGQIDEGCDMPPAMENSAGKLKSGLTEVQQLNARAIPNPSYNYFTLLIRSSNYTTVTVKIVDAVGREIEVRNGIKPNGAFQLGQNYKAGIYFAEITQGKEKTVVKLVKTK